ncbi:hypothetical protein [Nonomuraea helvata]|uniref:Uncharacterized protein n=1 Tax=Nonomuraea helvata TaxID=37484 RepID=A0ABV5SGC5_9ACTN
MLYLRREAELLAHLRALKVRRKQFLSQPSEPVVEYVRLGQTFTEAWEARDTDGRRLLLESAIAHIVVRPGTRGRRGIDPQRLDILWRNQYGQDIGVPGADDHMGRRVG